ncbi:HD-GYP domain-containing protein [Clostridium tetanomorphum]|uniref:HD domain-containing protein n=1 Tax=Clostridium tetanomorphum TaxID=1553 RepID=A0A923IZ42_CLOTT|nr:HD domain-containing phosphohydrolase [Clostridium tetanomorphum]MBC2397001.1 HD domain-containing protein [Clostridium tetanomorphum]NRZ99157.1 putative nucleotidyltransferase with HDIG domain [Clostridium tetanomorphum]
MEMNCSINNDFKVVKDEKISLETFLHSKRVAIYAKKIAQSMNYCSKEINILILAALYHDIGKSRVPLNIINKKGKLTSLEFETVKMYAKYGADILMENRYSKDFCDIVKFHHENYEGSGYHNLYRDSIPIASRIIRIADVFDALTTNRPYRKAYTVENALEIMVNEKHIYDPKIFNIFVKYLMSANKELKIKKCG